MPVISDFSLSLDEKAIRRYPLTRYSMLKEGLSTVLGELLATVNSGHMLRPAVAYSLYSITAIDDDRLHLEGDRVLSGSSLFSTLSKAEKAAVLVCTIGADLEKAVSDCFESDEPLRGLLLDVIGNAALDRLTKEACRRITEEASGSGFGTTIPLSPGMPGFPISEQRSLVELVPAGEIGVSLTPAGVMVPLKSISMVMGLGRDIKSEHYHSCDDCTLEDCLYRVRNS